MTGVGAPSRRLDAALLARLGQRCGVGVWPVVLNLYPAEEVAAQAQVAAARADDDLQHLGLFDYGEPSEWAATVLGVLGCPERELEIRTFGPDGVRRVCVARRGVDHVLAVRTGDDVDIRLVDIVDMMGLAELVRGLCGSADPLSFNSFSYPSDDFTERLSRCSDHHELASALYGMGAEAATASRVAAALARCRMRTEMVAVSRFDGVVTQSSGAVGILDTDRGRILASPSRSPDNRVWTTLSSGSGHRIAQAVGLLIGTLPDERWFP